jgi:hypothetical protein
LAFATGLALRKTFVARIRYIAMIYFWRQTTITPWG